jgi:hypothetical protein
MYIRFILKYYMQYMRHVMGAGLLLVETENKRFYYYFYYYYYIINSGNRLDAI